MQSSSIGGARSTSPASGKTLPSKSSVDSDPTKLGMLALTACQSIPEVIVEFCLLLHVVNRNRNGLLCETPLQWQIFNPNYRLLLPPHRGSIYDGAS